MALQLLLIFLTMATYTLSGRMVFAHVTLKRHNATPLACLITGFGVWFLWFLVLHGIVGAGLQVVWYTFLVSTFALSFVLTRILPYGKEQHLFWPKVIVGILLMVPALWWLMGDTPLLWAELTHYLKNNASFLTLGAVPSVGEAQKFDLFSPVSAMASQVIALPVMLMASSFVPATLPVMNVALLAFVAAELTRHSKLEITAINLTGVMGLSLLALVFLNPFFIPSMMFSAYPDILIAATLLAILGPLALNPKQPKSLEAIPYGLMLLFLGGIIPVAWWLVLLLLLIFFIFGQGYKKLYIFKHLGGTILLWGIPLMGLALELLMAQMRGYDLWPSILLDFSKLDVFSQFNAPYWYTAHRWLGAVPILLVLWSIVRIMQKRYSFMYIPTLLIGVYVICIGGVYAAVPEAPFAQGMFHHLMHLQFIILLPVWRLFFGGVQQFATVWSGDDAQTGTLGRNFSIVASLAFGISVFVFALFSKTAILGHTHLPLSHTLQVAAAMRQDSENVLWADRVAVLDSADTKGYYARALSYGLRHHAKVRPVLQAFTASGNLTSFHNKLSAQGFDYLWLHAPTPEILAMFGQNFKLEASYLLRITNKGFIPLKVYNHKGYTYKEAAAVPIF